MISALNLPQPNVALMNIFIIVAAWKEEKNPKPQTMNPLPIALQPYYFLVLDEDYKYGFHVSCTESVSIMFCTCLLAHHILINEGMGQNRCW